MLGPFQVLAILAITIIFALALTGYAVAKRAHRGSSVYPPTMFLGFAGGAAVLSLLFVFDRTAHIWTDLAVGFFGLVVPTCVAAIACTRLTRHWH